jgi:hypothetical protein
MKAPTILHGGPGQQDSTLDWERIQRLRSLIFSVLQTVCFITDEQIAAVLVLGQPSNVCPNTLVAGNENIEEFGSDEGIKILFHGRSVGFRNGQSLDSSRSQPFDEFIFPIFDE